MSDWLEGFASQADYERATRAAVESWQGEGVRLIDTRRGNVVLIVGNSDTWASTCWTPREALWLARCIVGSAVRAWLKGRRWCRRTAP